MKGHIRKRGNRWNIVEDIARFVRFAQRRKAERAEEVSYDLTAE